MFILQNSKGKIMQNIKLDYNDVLINPKPSAKSITRADVNIEMDLGKIQCTPVVIANMMSTGTYKIANIMSKHKILTFIHKEYTVKEHIENMKTLEDRSLVGFTTGVRPKDKDRTAEVLSKFSVGFINVDVANVYANVQEMVDTVSFFKKEFPNSYVVAGNVCNSLVLDPLLDAGADFIKVGVGPGAACKTRSEIGVGVPQFSAVQEVVAHVKKRGKRVIADGGCVTSGDICKAIGAGADLVMIGGMVSKSAECDNIVEVDGKLYVNFFGLGSKKQYNLTNPTEKEYRPNEGRDLLVPVTGSIEDVINQVKGALRSVCTYVGVDDINKLSENTDFIRVNNIINRSLEKYE
jgi:GMP reductase